jgi:hypothetical protein
MPRPVLGDRGGASEIRLDHKDEPRLGLCDAVSVEEAFEISEQEAIAVGQLSNPSANRVEAPSQLDRR